MEISSISMKENFDGEDTYFRMWVKAKELPEWMYLKAKEIDNSYGYLKYREEQYFEIEGYITSEGKATDDLRLVYYFDNYETITDLDENIHSNIYKAFEEFAKKYGDRLPNNAELCLGDIEYEEMIPQDLKDEWKNITEEWHTCMSGEKMKELIYKGNKEIDNFESKLNTVFYETLNTNKRKMFSPTIARGIIDTFDKCITDREFKIANEMLRGICRCNIEHLIYEIRGRDIMGKWTKGLY